MSNLVKYLQFRNVLKKAVAPFINVELNVFYQFTYTLFVVAALYTSSFLPYGRFYNRLGGNEGMLGAYLYTCIYLTFSIFRKPFILTQYTNTLFKNVKSLSTI